MDKNTMLLVMVSCEDAAQAERIGRELLKKKLAACIQIIGQVSSFYLWPPQKQHINIAEESILLIKTLESKWIAVEKEIQTLHTYENPEIIALPVTHVSSTYLTWLTQELK